jgi:hypothetical protein
LRVFSEMKFIIALLLAIPTYGISLVLLFVYMSFKTLSFSKNIKKAIVFLSTDSNPLGACIEEIHYAQALAYADEVGSITSRRGQYVEFTVEIDEVNYFVKLSREPGGNRAILTSRII